MNFVPLQVLAVVVTAATVLATADSTELSTADCVTRLDAIMENVARYQAGLTNQPSRLECVRATSLKLQVIRQLGGESAATVERLERAKSEEAQVEKEKLLALVARAEQLAEAARNCAAATTGSRPSKSSAMSTNKLPSSSTKPVTTEPELPVIPRPAWPARSEAECVRQGVAAWMLARTLGMSTDGGEAKVAAALGSRHIEPPGGWQLAECLTVDDFCVLLARSLGLKVGKGDEPTICVQALRDDGWPVDQFLPPRKAGVPVYLVEQEVRAFLAAGKMAPLLRAYAPATH